MGIELQALLEVVLDKFTDFMFTQVKNTRACFDTYQIQKFDPLKCAGFESNITNNHRNFESTCMKNKNEKATWETIFTEIISNDYKNTVIKFKTSGSGPMVYGLANVYVGIVDGDIKDQSQILSFTSTKLKYCAFKLAQYDNGEHNKSLVCTYDDTAGGRNFKETVSILNTVPPISILLHSDEFKLKYNRDSKLLTLSNNRGFSYSKKHCAD